MIFDKMELLKELLFWWEAMISARRGNAIRLLYAEAQLIRLDQAFSPDLNPEAEVAFRDQAIKKHEELRERVREAGISYFSRWFLLREIGDLVRQVAAESEPK